MTATIDFNNQGKWSIEYSKQATAMPSGRYSLSFSQFAAKLSRYAVPIITFAALATIPTAEAGPMAYGLCVEACFVLFPPFAPTCIFACLPLLKAPTP